MSSKIKISTVALALAACVAVSTSVFAEDAPARVRGTLQKMDGNNLTIATKSGKETNVPLKDGAPIIAVTEGAMSDIKDNTFVGITAMPQPDGTQKAVEVHVFEESLRGVGEGHYPWDLKPDSTMTNGAVAQQVRKVEGNTLQVKYKDGNRMCGRRWHPTSRIVTRKLASTMPTPVSCAKHLAILGNGRQTDSRFPVAATVVVRGYADRWHLERRPEPRGAPSTERGPSAEGRSETVRWREHV
jgi:hypothetical protein